MADIKDLSDAELIASLAPRAGIAGLSDQDLLAGLQATPARTLGSYIRGGAQSALKGATLGFSDELGANVEAGLGVAGDLLAGREPVDRYDEALAGWRGEQEQFAAENPGTATGLEIAGALTTGAPKKLARVLAQAGAYGFGAGEGGALERGEDALASALLTGGMASTLKGLGAAGRAVAPKLEDWASRAKLSALGIRQTDTAKSVKSPSGAWLLKQTGQNPIERAVATAEKEGIVKLGNTLDPRALSQKTGAAIDELNAKEIQPLIQAADKARGSFKVRPTFDNAEAFVKTVAGSERDSFANLLKAEQAAIGKQIDGSLDSLHNLKVAFNAKAYTPDTSTTVKKFYKQLTRDLKETIEDKIDSMVKAGRLPADKAGKLKALNRKEGDLAELQEIFTREAGAASSKDIMKTLIPLMRTSGGFGVPARATAIAGGGIPGAALAGGLGAALVSAQGRLATSAGLNKLAGGLGGQTIDAAAAPLSRALMAAYN